MKHIISEAQTSPGRLSSLPYKIISADVGIKFAKFKWCETENMRLSDPPLPVGIAK